MTPAEEASAILIRMLDTIAYSVGKRLKEEHKAEIRRACELLATDGALLPLDDLPRTSPGERKAAREYAAVPEEVARWREQQDDGD